MKDIISIFKNVGAIVTDSHFVGTSGRHMPTYLNKDVLAPHTTQASLVGKMFANKFKHKNIEVVVAPAVGGIFLSQWTTYHLSKASKRNVSSVFTEKTPNKDQIFKREYDKIVKNKRVLIVDDIATVGSSLKKLVPSVKKAGGTVIAACVMINRDPVAVNTKSIGVPFSSLGVLKIPSYEEKKCPLCKAGIPVNTSLGHGKKFLENLKAKNKRS